MIDIIFELTDEEILNILDLGKKQEQEFNEDVKEEKINNFKDKINKNILSLKEKYMILLKEKKDKEFDSFNLDKLNLNKIESNKIEADLKLKNIEEYFLALNSEIIENKEFENKEFENKELKNKKTKTKKNIKDEYEKSINFLLSKYIKMLLIYAFLFENINENKIYLSCEIVTNKEIKEINKETRNIDKETDVLSFPMFDKYDLEDLIYKNIKYKNIIQEVNNDLEKFQNKTDKKLNENIEQIPLGDIILSLELANIQSKEYNHSILRELSYLIIHSFYHILGYDHIDPDDKKIMRDKEEILLNKLNITREN